MIHQKWNGDVSRLFLRLPLSNIHHLSGAKKYNSVADAEGENAAVFSRDGVLQKYQKQKKWISWSVK